MRYLFKCITFSALLLAQALLLQQVLLIGLRKYQTRQAGTWNQVTHGLVNAEILILGSSRAHVHADPRIFTAITHKSAYNIGREGTAIDLQLAFFEMYLRHNRAPKYLVLCLDSYTFAPDWFRILQPELYIAHLNEPEIATALSHREQIWNLYRLFPLIGIVRFAGTRELAFCGLCGHAELEDQYNGFLPVTADWGPEFEEFKKYHPNGISYDISQSSKEHLHQLLDLCRRQHIQTVLVFPPEYIESQAMTSNRQDVITVYQEFSNEFKIPFWNYSTDPICEKKDYFYNSQHLNLKGATLFSHDCATHLESLIASPRQ